MGHLRMSVQLISPLQFTTVFYHLLLNHSPPLDAVWKMERQQLVSLLLVPHSSQLHPWVIICILQSLHVLLHVLHGVYNLLIIHIWVILLPHFLHVLFRLLLPNL